MVRDVPVEVIAAVVTFFAAAVPNPYRDTVGTAVVLAVTTFTPTPLADDDPVPPVMLAYVNVLSAAPTALRARGTVVAFALAYTYAVELYAFKA